MFPASRSTCIPWLVATSSIFRMHHPNLCFCHHVSHRSPPPSLFPLQRQLWVHLSNSRSLAYSHLWSPFCCIRPGDEDTSIFVYHSVYMCKHFACLLSSGYFSQSKGLPGSPHLQLLLFTPHLLSHHPQCSQSMHQIFIANFCWVPTVYSCVVIV